MDAELEQKNRAPVATVWPCYPFERSATCLVAKWQLCFAGKSRFAARKRKTNTFA